MGLAPWALAAGNAFIAKPSPHTPSLAVWLAEGRLWVPIDSAYALENANEALARLASGEVRGKVVVVVGPE